MTDDGSGTESMLPQAKAAARSLEEITGIHHERYSCCVNSCLVFTGAYVDLTACPLCDEPRFDSRQQPRKTFDFIPVIHRLRLQYADPERAIELKSYRRRLEMDEWSDGLRDYWDGDLHREHKAQGFFADEHDIAFALSTDGLDLFKVGQFQVWPLLLVNLNLDPIVRVKKCNLIQCGIIPGPRSPKDIHSFLRPLMNEFKNQEIGGVPNVYDASTDSTFTLRFYLTLVCADLPAMAKLMGISGHNSLQYCRFCECEGVFSKHTYCPLQSPHDWSKEPFDYDPADLPLRTDDGYREAANTNLRYPQALDPDPPAKPPYGVSQYSSLYELATIDFPRSFPNDIMHVVFENVVPKLYKWWTGAFLKKKDDMNVESEIYVEENDKIVLDKENKNIWKIIGQNMSSSRSTIPTSYGRSLRDIAFYNKSFKAEEWCS